MMRYLSIIGLSALLSYSAQGQAHASEAQTASDICGQEDLAFLDCDGDRDCALKTESVISEFIKNSDGPQMIESLSFTYPPECLFESDQHEVVNFVFDITPRGRTKNKRILNSSNSCFNGRARTALRLARFEKTESGFRCGILPVVFDRAPIAGEAAFTN